MRREINFFVGYCERKVVIKKELEWALTMTGGPEKRYPEKKGYD